MHWKVRSDEKCPRCGRNQAIERIHRSRIIRIVFPNARLMKCRLCLTRYLVRRQEAERSQAV